MHGGRAEGPRKIWERDRGEVRGRRVVRGRRGERGRGGERGKRGERGKTGGRKVVRGISVARRKTWAKPTGQLGRRAVRGTRGSRSPVRRCCACRLSWQETLVAAWPLRRMRRRQEPTIKRQLRTESKKKHCVVSISHNNNNRLFTETIR